MLSVHHAGSCATGEPLGLVHVLANPNARSGRGARVLPELEAALRTGGHEVRSSRTEAPGHARALASELTRRGDPGPLVVVGGDGTLHEVANGLCEAGFPDGFPLVVLPVGTGNDFHRMVRAGSGVAAAVELVATGVPRRLDVGEARWAGGSAVFVNLLGVGIDVEVLRRRDAFARLPGLLQYGGALLSALRRFTPTHLEVSAFSSADGSPGRSEKSLLEADALLAAVTVGPSIGGGFMLSPEARPDDGLLDLFFVEPLGLLQVLRYLPRVVRGTLDTPHRIHRATFPAGRLVSRDDQPFAFELDGELMPDTTTWLEMSIRSGALTILDLE
ncbi:MAG: diacylglycerol kinase family lipid kinase [Gemmatimonadales bacterium]|nr:MAG: diacylglycerol kinase family lipid kinase [Gemmatimonadales bacterium]